MAQPLTQVSEHIYWMPPGPPDRPSLCAVVSGSDCLMLDAGASAAHAREFLAALVAMGLPAPRFVMLTHWHWDHVFGAAALDVPVIAHVATAERLDALSGYVWDDAALDARLATGEEITFCADNIKLELPSPREVQIARASIVFQGAIEIRIGDVACSIMHVGGDHAADSCIVYVAPDSVVFLGDCLYDAIYTPVRHYTTAKLLPLLDTLTQLDGEHWIEGHTPGVMSAAEFQALAAKMRAAASLVEQLGTDETYVLSVARADGHDVDADFEEIVRGLIAGRQLTV